MTKRWGPITWFLLHTFAEKIHNSAFLANRANYLNLIFNLCCNLPCPDCSNHAKIYLTRARFKYIIKTKNELRLFLWKFHNNTNTRLKKEQQNISILKMYFNGNFEKIITLFSKEIFKQVGSTNILNLMYKNIHAQKIIDTINANKSHFFK